jgi:protein-tyrosine-phosphatase
MTAPRSILFVCGENALRSPMAEGIVKRLYGGRVYVDSVGIRGGVLDQMAVSAMTEIGIDISDHEPKALDELMDLSFDLVVSLSGEAHRHALDLARGTATEVEYWITPDPSIAEGSRETRLMAYREVRDALTARIRERLGPDDGAAA